MPAWGVFAMQSKHVFCSSDLTTIGLCMYPAGRPVLFTGEMVFPWMLQDFAYLQPFKEAADLLADKQDWPALYSSDTLQQNKVGVHVGGGRMSVMQGWARVLMLCKLCMLCWYLVARFHALGQALQGVSEEHVGTWCGWLTDWLTRVLRCCVPAGACCVCHLPG